MTRPLLLIDVDGPLNPFAAKAHRRPAGYETFRWTTPRWLEMERARLAAWGMPKKRVKPLRVWLNSAHGAALAGLPYELAWGTTWKEEANDFVAPVLGLPKLAVVEWAASRETPRPDMFWKTPQLSAWAAGRPFAWIDDEIGPADQEWVRDHHPAPALLLRIDPRLGFCEEDAAQLRLWAAELAG